MMTGVTEAFGADSDSDVPEPQFVLGEPHEQIHIPEDDLPEQGGRYAFQGEVAEKFEQEVISTQIPGYKRMRETLARLSLEFLQTDSSFVDIGTSTGRMLRDVMGKLAVDQDSRLAKCDFVGLDVEEEMLAQARKYMDDFLQKDVVVQATDAMRLKRVLHPRNDRISVTLREHDLRTGFTGGLASPPSVITSVLVLQFVPMDYRTRVLRDIYDALKPGGALILVEKVFSPSRRLDDLANEMYYEFKQLNGISTDAIFKKRSNLENVLIPLTHRANMELLRGAGFREENIECFWRDIQFETLVAVKE